MLGIGLQVGWGLGRDLFPALSLLLHLFCHLLGTEEITPDHAVIMAIEVTDDAPVAGSANISTNHINTTVQVNNGDTVVLGGIFRENRSNITNKLPVLGDLPLVGGLFRNQQRMAAESELLVFITPKILPRADSAR